MSKSADHAPQSDLEALRAEVANLRQCIEKQEKAYDRAIGHFIAVTNAIRSDLEAYKKSEARKQ